jgi:CRISPR/Cas system-associated exonuclease Cas4 (RecB family)
MTTITQSMVASLLQCPAKFSFEYGDMAGFPIRPKVPALRLREGRAWGEAAQRYHAYALSDHPRAVSEATRGIVEMLEEDAQAMRDAGMWDETEHDETVAKMFDILAHYCATSEPLNLIQREHELSLVFPDFTYQCHIDGVHQDPDGGIWIVEFKLRGAGRMTPLDQIQLWRQIRWYALSYGVNYGQPVRGVIVDERLNDAPKPVRYNKDGAVSATQSCTYEAYLAACAERRQMPHDPTSDRLLAKTWHQRHELILTADEMEDARIELGSAAKLTGLYRDHELAPIRNPGPLCATCAYNVICPSPSDDRLREAMYAPNERALA